MSEGAETGSTYDPAIGPLAERAIEILITHNEAVARGDLACALNISDARAWEIATTLRTLGYAVLDEQNAMITATPQASNPNTLG